MKFWNKNTKLVIFLIAIILISGCKTTEETPNNFLLIGWDGAERSTLLKLLEQEKLPNLQRLIDEGKFVKIDTSQGSTHTKPGWSQILTGYNTDFLEITGNEDYKPLPYELTIFGRLDSDLKHQNTAKIFIAGKENNMGSRGPHKICINCKHRYPTREKTRWWEENTSAPLLKGETQRLFVFREGEAFFHVSKNVDVFMYRLGTNSNVGNKALEILNKYENEKFFAFIHFEEPDELGHRFGGSSEEYKNSLIENDEWLGKIIKQLEENKLYDKTIIIVATDHGLDPKGFGHKYQPEIFLVSNYKDLKESGDRRDIAPTILDLLEIDEISPPLHGKSLVVK